MNSPCNGGRSEKILRGQATLPNLIPVDVERGHHRIAKAQSGISVNRHIKMKILCTVRRVCLLLGITGLLGVVALASDPPEVLKVEPPNWWAGHTINPVRLLIH